MKSLLARLSFIVLLFAVLSSCSEKQDFGQYNDLELTPTFEASILYIEAPESSINSVSDTTFISTNFSFEAFSEKAFAKRVIDGVIVYEVENTTSKLLRITIEFLDGDANVLDTEIFLIDPVSTSILRREIVYGDTGRSIEIIKNTSGLSLSASNLGDNTSISNLPDPKITLKSFGKFRVRIK
ncbi:MAG: hypothetical protein COC08_00820 [Maribacter sp.]|nr:MAG: hypothetical protein COC08_00820 [Maribacter sp.]